MTTKRLTVTAVDFQRKQGDRVEQGIMINEDHLIIDRDGKVVKALLWNYTLCPYEGRITFTCSAPFVEKSGSGLSK